MKLFASANVLMVSLVWMVTEPVSQVANDESPYGSCRIISTLLGPSVT